MAAPMRVLFDHQIFLGPPFGGVSRYFSQLVQTLAVSGEAQPILPLHYATNHYLWHAPKPWRRRGLPLRYQFRGRRRIEELLEKWLTVEPTRRAITRGHYDIFHPTYFDPYFLPLPRGKPYVLTVYDLIAEKFPDAGWVDPQVEWKPQIIPGATRIIAISNSTKRDLVQHYGVSPDKIDVVYLAGGMSALTSEPVEISKPYVLFVGARRAYKNFTAFAKAVAPLLLSDLTLYCAGGWHFTPDEMALLRALGIAHKVHQSQVSDSQLAFLYRNAAVFVYPSLYEGFGIPVVEAMSCRCPTVTSNTSSFPEVGGDAVVYFDPTSPTSIRYSIEKVLNDRNLRHELVERGASRAREFSWAQCASRTADVYARALGRTSL